MYFAVIVCFAISNSIARSLNYPTPINPSVLIETKPEEKVILISDIKEISKFKRETSKPFYPTITPEQAHHISKRENVFRHSVRYERDIPVPLVAKHKHPEISASENGDSKSTDENVESFANDQVVKDKNKQDAAKSEGSQPVSHPDHTPETLTTHSVIRPKPVSVSELFSR